MYLIQYQLDYEQWFTCNRRRNFVEAKRLAKRLYREMKGAHMTAVIQDGDPPILRRRYDYNFELS